MEKELSPQQWEDRIQGLVRRTWLAAAREKGGFFRGERERVREIEERERTKETIGGFLGEEASVFPPVGKLAENLSSFLKKKFPEVEAVVLMGSSVNGGGFLRNWVGGDGPHDLDWGLITNRPLPADRAGMITWMAAGRLPGLAQRFGLGHSFHMCNYINPQSFWIERLLEKKDALRLLCQGNLGGSSSEIFFCRLLLFFRPSFPSAVNQRNRSIFLGFLSDLLGLDKRDDVNLLGWLRLGLVREWERVTRLKGEYFSRPNEKGELVWAGGRERDAGLEAEVVAKSASLMSIRFKAILEGLLKGR